ncbi:unnamed protein product [Triticum turgidum subsp. durum]|uniref:DUF1618 domain-containing protein n=1 Tax=Triticum turgidum subsp. durum TaxID=4567 RepID=A0A9R1BPL0_TRITD|nr:unnamed protein product [Triticum turgidum subsp. durum]
MTSTGHTVGVTFHLANPPAVSHFSVHGPRLKREDFEGVPEVVSAQKDLVLLRLALTFGPRIRSGTPGSPDRVLHDYFVYEARRGMASLKLIPVLYTYYKPMSICIVPSDDGEFLIAAFLCTNHVFEEDRCVFSFKTGKWSSCERLELKIPPEINYHDLPRPTDKVILLGGGEVGLVDLRRGIKICNVLDADPVFRLIPLPKAEFFHDNDNWDDSQLIRDVVVCDGFIQLVEIDRRFRQVLGVNDKKKSCKKMTSDFDKNTDIIYDSEVLHRNHARPELIPVPDGWKIRTCYRHKSWDYWLKGHVVDVDGSFDHVPELSDGGAGKYALRDLATAYPVLSVVPSEDVVYLTSKVKSDDTKAWMVALHLRSNTLEALGPYSASYFKRPKFLVCAFSEYLNTPPNQVPA